MWRARAGHYLTTGMVGDPFIDRSHAQRGSEARTFCVSLVKPGRRASPYAFPRIGTILRGVLAFFASKLAPAVVLR